MKKPSQLMSSQGLAPLGAMASRGSSAVPQSRGKSFAAMESAMLSKGKPHPKKMAKGGPGRQFFTQAAGGDM